MSNNNNSESIENAVFYDGPDGFDMVYTDAYYNGCIAGDYWMNQGGDKTNIPKCPYKSKEIKEWQNGFNSRASEDVF